MIDLNKRAPALVVITAIYAICGAIGIFSYLYLPSALPWQLKLLIADAVATILVFSHSVIYDNASEKAALIEVISTHMAPGKVKIRS